METHYYIFRQNPVQLQTWLRSILPQSSQRQYIVWQYRNKLKDHVLLVVKGQSLPLDLCLENNIWETNEEVYRLFYEKHPHKFFVSSVEKAGRIYDEMEVA